MFFKKLSKSSIVDQLAQEQQRLSSLPLPKAQEEYMLALADYEREIANKWDLLPEGYDENSSIAAIRDDIHHLIMRFRDFDYDFDKKRLSDLDKTWQKWCLSRIQIDLISKNRYSSGNRPKTEWWWWIDRLDELSEDERSTI